MPGNLSDLFSDSHFQRELLHRIEEGWTYEKIEPMSTDEILARLKRLGIAMTPKKFRRAARQHESAERLADEWYEQYPFSPQEPYDEDFVWMAAVVLWKRLLPDRVSFEQIDEQMQEGYDLLLARRTTEACDVWGQVWEWLKEKVTPERNTLQALDEAFRGTQAVYNWCQDFEMHLENAGARDPRYHRLRIRYCQEFLETFSEEEDLMRGSFLRAEWKACVRSGHKPQEKSGASDGGAKRGNALFRTFVAILRLISVPKCKSYYIINPCSC